MMDLISIHGGRGNAQLSDENPKRDTTVESHPRTKMEVPVLTSINHRRPHLDRHVLRRSWSFGPAEEYDFQWLYTKE